MSQNYILFFCLMMTYQLEVFENTKVNSDANIVKLHYGHLIMTRNDQHNSTIK